MISAKVRTKGLVNTLYLHDEPDISLHPSGARYLRDELIKISEDNFVVFSSHSIFMVDRELLRRHLIVEKKKEITTVKEVNESNIVDEEVIYNALGYSIFENLKEFNIIFEGWRDKRLCQIALKNLPAQYRRLKARFSEVGMCHARGARDIGRITPMLELANRKWIIVSDGDRSAKEQQRFYKGDGSWFRYDELISGEIVVTGEDFLKSEALRPHLEVTRSEKPQLGDFDITLLSSSQGKIEVIRRWLTDGGLGVEEVRTLLESLKERVFNDLKGSHIEEKYYSMLSNLAAKFP
jgi:ribosomal protein L7/L12